MGTGSIEATLEDIDAGNGKMIFLVDNVPGLVVQVNVTAYFEPGEEQFEQTSSLHGFLGQALYEPVSFSPPTAHIMETRVFVGVIDEEDAYCSVRLDRDQKEAIREEILRMYEEGKIVS